METYILSIEDLFRVEAENEEEARQFLMENIGHEPFLVSNPEVVEVED